MVARLSAVVVLVVVGITLVTARPTDTIQRIALLAPFEGRYREVGYNAYYAALLALQDHEQVELLAIDDGGSISSAVDRAKALAQDPLVVSVVVLGYEASAPETQHAFGDIPVVVAGGWSAEAVGERVFLMSAPGDLTTPNHIGVIEAAEYPAPVVGGDVFALGQFPKLRDTLDGVIVVASQALPTDEFRNRYLESAVFAPEPGLPAMYTFEAFGLILVSEDENGLSREGILSALSNRQFQNAPLYYYAYDGDGRLTPVDRPVE